MSYDIIIVRKNMWDEILGAYLFNKHKKSEIIIANPEDVFSVNTMDMLIGKKVLMVGGYHTNSVELIITCAYIVEIFLKPLDIYIANIHPKCKYHVSSPDHGFLHWTLTQLNLLDKPVESKLAEYLDSYLYGFPSNDAICFQHGITYNDGYDIFERLICIQNVEDIEYYVHLGREKTYSNFVIASNIYVERSINVDISTYPSVSITTGGYPILETCILLARNSSSGIGMIFEYDLRKKNTYIICRVTKESGLNAGTIMHELFGGWGIKPEGYAVLSGLYFPYQTTQK